MDEKFLNEYIAKLLANQNLATNRSSFENDLEAFSKFLAYTNPDYKYNGTFLTQFIDDFFIVIAKLKIKDSLYRSMADSIILGNDSIETRVEFDEVFLGRKDSNNKIQKDYICFNKEKIVQDKLAIRVFFKNEDGDEYIYCKNYNLPERGQTIQIQKDLRVFKEWKKIGEEPS